MAAGGVTLEYTPTWVVALVCSIIIIISLALERFLHSIGKVLKKNNQNPLFEALQKVKEELMLLGFISLLMTVFQGMIVKICIPPELANILLPCKKEAAAANTTSHFQSSVIPSDGNVGAGGRHLLAAAASDDYCAAKGKAPLLSITALHHLHLFIFVLAVVHVAFCALTIFFGGAKIRKWRKWEESITKEEHELREIQHEGTLTTVREHAFVKNRFQGCGQKYAVIRVLRSFFKQFYGSVTKSDYTTLRLGFVRTHCRGNPKFDFHKYLMRTLEADFKKVVGISWYLWLLVVVFFLANVYGSHSYMWIEFIPFILLLAVGTKLEHVITQLAHEVAEKHVAIEGDLVVQPSDDHFWFHKPKIILFLIHVILFQNSFELAYLFGIWVQYGSNSCIMGQISYVIPRLILGAFIQFLCSYSTLPLYVLVAQMGSSFRKAIFDEHVQEGLVGWAKLAKKKMANKSADDGKLSRKQLAIIEGNAEGGTSGSNGHN